LTAQDVDTTPGTSRNAGIKKRDFEVGETVTITGAPAKDGTPHKTPKSSLATSLE
jgi:hypothetical protein